MRTNYLFLILLLLLVIAACQITRPAVPTPAPSTVTFTPAPTSTATLSPTPTPAPTHTPKPTATPDKGTYNPENGHWYRLMGFQTDWHTAQAYCAKLGAHLVTLENASEDRFINKMTSYTWLGATDELKEGQWEWVTGEPWPFTNWAPGEPNNCGNPTCDPEHYLTYHGDHPTQWNDVPDGALDFICEWEQ
jgi:hypothetical protein